MKKTILTLAIVIVAGLAAAANAQTFQILHQFNDVADHHGVIDGDRPLGGLFRDASGNIYGTTASGGGQGNGVVYKLKRTGKESVLFAFGDPNITGANPLTPLIQDQAGNLLGIADGGPAFGGVIFRISATGVETIVHAFDTSHKAELLTGGILLDAKGSIFGTSLTAGIGPCRFFVGCGVVFQIDRAGRFHSFYRFTGGSDGSRPFGPLVEDVDGNLYGIAQQGGDLNCTDLPDPEFPEAGCGTVFKLSKQRELTVLHTFEAGADGAGPQPGILRDAAGNLYGTTDLGGTSDQGTVFKIASDGTYTLLHTFNGTDGRNPKGYLVADEAGNLYGTTQAGGVNGLGTVYELTPAGQLIALYNFTGGEDGVGPLSGVIRDGKGNLYGTTDKTVVNGRAQGGNLFEITP
ncbi:MAG TPA: choice-of-anchor tandem repeat GloVer-containing protein [Terriglobales bacterium]|nr:choice-of-anchor tandem repeat GloVer-containing protein [Terriglobales bacterium]